MFGILLYVTNCENGKYLVSIMDDSVIICDEVIDVKAKSDDEKTYSPNKYNLQNIKFLCFTCILIN